VPWVWLSLVWLTLYLVPWRRARLTGLALLLLIFTVGLG
jgi:hypothetical protein